MSKSFLDQGMGDKIAIFNVFFRQAPDGNNWAVACGMNEVIEMIQNIGNQTPEFFQNFLPEENYRNVCEYFSKMKFTGSVYSMREGEIVYPRQPIMIIKAPICEAQVLETPLLCILNHQMAVATKASRVCRATTKPVSEFGSRRAHGPWAATYGAKAAYIGGCVNSSNILSSVHFGVPCSGTMAHSFVTVFGCSLRSELTAFEAYIDSHLGEPLILLIDTYDTLRSGIKNAIEAFKNKGIGNGYKPLYGVRLDSGDLAYLAENVREELDKAGFTEAKIVASNGLDEYLIMALERQSQAIDMYGVGDAIATSKHNPCFGNVYKLVQVDDMPVLKRSEDIIKLINPGFQITYRIFIDGKSKADVTCIRGDKTSQTIEQGETFTIRDETDVTKTTTFTAGSYTYRALQELVMENGVRIVSDVPVEEKRKFFFENLNSIHPTQRRLTNPHYHKVDISNELYDLKLGIIYKLKKELEDYGR